MSDKRLTFMSASRTVLAALVFTALTSVAAAGPQATTATDQDRPPLVADGLDAGTKWCGSRGYPASQAYIRDPCYRVGYQAGKFLPSQPNRKRVEPSPVPSPIVKGDIPLPINDLKALLATHPITDLLIAKDGKLVFEAYQYGRSETDLMISYSIAKTIAGLAVGVALDQNLVRFDGTLADYVSEFRTAKIGAATIKDALRMSCGTDLVHTDVLNLIAGKKATGGENNIIHGWVETRDPRADLVKIIAGRAQAFKPGSMFNYDMLCSDALAIAVASAARADFSSYFESAIWKKIGAQYPAYWLTDIRGNEEVADHFWASPRDWIRLGIMLANRGEINGVQVVSADFVAQLGSAQIPHNPAEMGQNQEYGFQVWLTRDPVGMFIAFGAFGQILCIYPVSRTAIYVAALEDDPQVDANRLLFRIIKGWRN